MSSIEKLKNRIWNNPTDITYSELCRLLESYGYESIKTGKTSGSRVRFYRESDGDIILLHKPHPGNIVNQCFIKEIVKKIKEAES